MALMRPENTMLFDTMNQVLAKAPITHIDWDDGCIEPIIEGKMPEHYYKTDGYYTIKVFVEGWGWMPLDFNTTRDPYSGREIYSRAMLIDGGATFKVTFIKQPRLTMD